MSGKRLISNLRLVGGGGGGGSRTGRGRMGRWEGRGWHSQGGCEQLEVYGPRPLASTGEVGAF